MKTLSAAPLTPATCAMLASGQTPPVFADTITHTFFPALDMAPPPFMAHNCLAAYAAWFQAKRTSRVSCLRRTDNLDADTVVAYTDASVSGTTIPYRHCMSISTRGWPDMVRIYESLHHRLTLLSWLPHMNGLAALYLYHNLADALSSGFVRTRRKLSTIYDECIALYVSLG
ncbi:hypothetical protein MRX96_050386 [Rhipicephalus microplus]